MWLGNASVADHLETLKPFIISIYLSYNLQNLMKRNSQREHKFQ